MTNEPTKAAIERACEMLNAECGRTCYVAPHSGHDPDVKAFARHLDQVSETAKAAKEYVSESTQHGTETAYALEALILPDPEPDVMEPNPIKIGAACGAVADAVFPSNFDRGQRDKLADALVTLCREVRAITKTGEAGQ